MLTAADESLATVATNAYDNMLRRWNYTNAIICATYVALYYCRFFFCLLLLRSRSGTRTCCFSTLTKSSVALRKCFVVVVFICVFLLVAVFCNQNSSGNKYCENCKIAQKTFDWYTPTCRRIVWVNFLALFRVNHHKQTKYSINTKV